MMDAYFSPESHEDLRHEVRKFAETGIGPLVCEMESTRAVEREIVRAMAQKGWIGLTVGREYGGRALGHLAKAIAIEEVSRVSGAMGAALQASQLGVAKILHFGNEEQKRTWLPAVARGECLPTIAVTEEGSGGHVLGLQTRARRERDEWVLDGRKVFVGNSHVGDLHGVVVRTGPGSRGLSAFLVEAGRPGLSLGEHRPAMGLHGFSFGELRFDGCRVPARNLLGREGEGLAVAYSSSVLYGRANLAAVALGIHRALVEETLAFAAERRRYGRPLSALGEVRQLLGAMQSRLMTSRVVLYHACALLDAGRPCDAEMMNAKLVNVEGVLASARDALEVHGACGLFTDLPIERHLRDAHHLLAPAGTSQIQRLRLAEMALGAGQGQWSERLAAGKVDGELALP